MIQAIIIALQLWYIRARRYSWETERGNEIEGIRADIVGRKRLHN
jgi:hypothetical protein